MRKMDKRCIVCGGLIENPRFNSVICHKDECYLSRCSSRRKKLREDKWAQYGENER